MEDKKEIYQKYIDKHYIKAPEQCQCGNKKLALSKNNRVKNLGYCFRCTRKNCKKIYSLFNNSFFEEFKSFQLKEILAVFRCFIDYKFNSIEAKNYLSNTMNIIISERIIKKIYKKIRKYIYLYYTLDYASEIVGRENENKYYSTDESLFTHDLNGQQLWLIGFTDNVSKDFHIVATKNRDAVTLETFIRRMIPVGNNIVTDGWPGYDWMDQANSGYRRFPHIHGQNDFGHGVESTSHIESIWGQLKDVISSIYKSIPCINFLYFVREAEWRIKKKNLSYEEKLDDFFEMYNTVMGIDEEFIYDSDFLNNDDINNLFNENDDE